MTGRPFRLTRDDWLRLVGDVPRPAASLDLTAGPDEDADGHLVRRVTYRSDERTVVPAYLLIPKRPLSGRPGLVCCHGYGHFEWGKGKVAGRAPGAGIEWDAQAAEAADRGFAVIAPDMHGFEERRPDSRLRAEAPDSYDGREFILQETLRLVLRGSSYQARCLADLRGAVDALCESGAADGGRIGMFGQSFGGWETLFLAMYDARIKAGVCSCGVTLIADIAEQARPFGLQAFIPGLLTKGDMDDIFPHIAPRPLLLLFGREDRLTRPDPTRRIVERAHEAYRAAGAEDRLAVHVHERGHSFHSEMRVMAFDWLQRWLASPEGGAS